MPLSKDARKASEEAWLRDYEAKQGKALNDPAYHLPGGKRTKHHGRNDT